MIIDITLFCILIVIMATSYRNGFISTFMHLMGWIVSLGCGLFFTPQVKAYLIEKDYFYSSIKENLLTKMPAGIPNGSLESQGIPSLVGDFINNITDSVAENIAGGLTELIMIILSFLIVVIAVKFFLYIIIALFSKKNREGATGFIDGMLGLGFGFAKGMIVLYVLLAILIPVINLTSPDTSFAILTSLDSSLMAKDLYNNNPLLLLINQL